MDMIKNTIKVGDYVEGIEIIGSFGNRRARIMRGTIGQFNHDGSVTIQADDGYEGARGTTLLANSFHLKEKVSGWWNT